MLRFWGFNRSLAPPVPSAPRPPWENSRVPLLPGVHEQPPPTRPDVAGRAFGRDCRDPFARGSQTAVIRAKVACRTESWVLKLFPEVAELRRTVAIHRRTRARSVLGMSPPDLDPFRNLLTAGAEQPALFHHPLRRRSRQSTTPQPGPRPVNVPRAMSDSS
jgi:hypothetical protein